MIKETYAKLYWNDVLSEGTQTTLVGWNFSDRRTVMHVATSSGYYIVLRHIQLLLSHTDTYRLFAFRGYYER